MIWKVPPNICTEILLGFPLQIHDGIPLPAVREVSLGKQHPGFLRHFTVKIVSERAV
jgi:hypothetical protein